ncbi:dihydrofolate reductase [Phialemonium atrogriseum]|uniref:Dihydrofolate reductase n=1 Tax=Phialemonium atrogriseum TaxID=1093897 RepID=A0AAJ0C1V7_9PEZI|nr:dihydrofolate reductase [Phialemonium atrogriseum]KAK1768609.1 dihydrofolate reductase [Phialemonium atrogriseum]
MPHPELTLIVAATRDMGIGLNGTLPWTGLKKEMAYFARVTKRLPPQTQPPAINAVIMGRKTWDSIPSKFRPLKGRLNIVISRSPSTSASTTASTSSGDEGPVHATSLEQALEQLRAARSSSSGRVFVVGGAQVYGAALGSGLARRVLLTRVLTGGIECDTFFPLGALRGEGKGEEGWARRSKEEMDAWVGEVVPEGVQLEGETEYEFEMWERVDGDGGDGGDGGES